MENINAVIQEAAERLRIMNLHPNVLKEFQKDGTRYYSERSIVGRQVCGILYWLRNRPEWMKKIRELEEKRNIFVYAAIHEYASFGELLTLFMFLIMNVAGLMIAGVLRPPINSAMRFTPIPGI